MYGKRSDERTRSQVHQKLNDYLEQHTESARRIDEEKIQFVLHIFPGKMNDIMREIDEWIRRSQG